MKVEGVRGAEVDHDCSRPVEGTLQTGSFLVLVGLGQLLVIATGIGKIDLSMDNGREMMIKQDWKQILDAGELDEVIARMFRLDRTGAPG